MKVKHRENNKQSPPSFLILALIWTAVATLIRPSTMDAEAREVLPPIAYFNRTMFPPLVLYRGSGEHLRIVQKLQHLQNEYDFEHLTAKNADRAAELSRQIELWDSIRKEHGDDVASSRVEALDGSLPERPLLSMAIVSDIQYAPKEEAKRRHFRMSKMKLQHAVSEIIANRSQHVDLMMNLGDTVDDAIDTILPEILPIFDQLHSSQQSTLGNKSSVPVYHMLGNHDFLGTTSKEFDSLHTRLGMPSRYYAIDVVTNKDGTGKESRKSFRLIILDGNDLAIYSTDPGSEKRKLAEEMLGALKRRRAKNAQIFNGGLGVPQIEWLKTQLFEACSSGKLVFVFLHHPMRPRNEPTNLWNDVEIVPILASYGCVLAVINGHAHKYLYDYQHTTHRDMHFITFGGMVQSPFTSWGFVDVFEDKLRVHGLIFGRPIDYWYDVSDKSSKYHPITSSDRGTAPSTSGAPLTTKIAEVFVSSAPESGKTLRPQDQMQIDALRRELRGEASENSETTTNRFSSQTIVSFDAGSAGLSGDMLVTIGTIICAASVALIALTLGRAFKLSFLLKSIQIPNR